jgi:hypothetical protein
MKATLSCLFAFFLLLLLPSAQAFALNVRQPTITFSYIPSSSSAENGFVYGNATGVNPASYRVALYILVPGWGWVTKPYLNDPTVAINADGSWQARFVTGGKDGEAVRFAAFVVSSTYVPPAILRSASLPSVSTVTSIEVARPNPASRTIVRNDTLQVMLIKGPSSSTNHPEVTLYAPPEWVVVGGGGFTDWPSHRGYGSLLTGSFPSLNLDSWTVRAKDHGWADPCLINAFAIAIKAANVSRAALLNQMELTYGSSGTTAHPAIQVSIPGGHLLLGGGFDVNFGQGTGNMGVDSRPNGSSAWVVESKDHIWSSPAPITGYAVSIKPSFPNAVGGTVRLANAIVPSGISARVNHPSATASLPGGYTLVGGGADVTYLGYGSMLWALYPNDSLTTWTGGSKDHGYADPSTIKSWAIGLTVQ